MFNKKVILSMSLFLVIAILVSGCSNSTANTIQGEVSTEKKLTFDEWANQELVWPEWATPIEVDPSTVDGSKRLETVEFTFYIDQARESIRKLRYLVENFEDNISYNVWKSRLGVSLVQVGENHLGYHYLNEIYNLPDDAPYGTKRGSDEPEQIGNSPMPLKYFGDMLKAIARAGYPEEAVARYEAHDYEANPNDLVWHVNGAAWAMQMAGEDEELAKILDFGINRENKQEFKLVNTVTDTLTAAATSYANGDYEKVISYTDTLIAEGLETSPTLKTLVEEEKEHVAKHAAENKKASEENGKAKKKNDAELDHPNRQWESTYQLIETYRDLAERAMNGEVVTFTDLKDGEYTSSNTGYMLNPIEVTVTIKDGKVTDIKATQSLPREDRPGAAIDTIPSTVLDAQSLEVDAISSSTISSESIKLSIAEALLKAKK